MSASQRERLAHETRKERQARLEQVSVSQQARLQQVNASQHERLARESHKEKQTRLQQVTTSHARNWHMRLTGRGRPRKPGNQAKADQDRADEN